MAIWRRNQPLFLTKPNLLHLSSKTVSPKSDQSRPNETLISSVVSILKEQRSKSRWNFIKSLHPNGFSPSEVSQITLHLKNNPHLALRFFLWSEKNSLCKHDLISYSTIIHILARSRLKSTAQTLIQTAIRVSESDSDIDGPDLVKPPKIFETLAKTYRSCDSAPFVFDLLIKACLQASRIDQTVEIVRMLRSRGIYPLIGTCNSLIRSVSKSRGSEAGFAIYREIFYFESKKKSGAKVRVCPNIQTFNTLMLSCYQDGKMEKIEGICKEMETFNCELNLFSYCILIAASCDEEKMDEAVRLWEEMEVKEIKPDIMAYNTLIGGFCRIREMEKAEELFRELGLKEMEPTCLTYEHLIKGYCEIGDADSAVLLYEDMRRRGFMPETSTVDAVIEGLSEKNRVFEGLEFFREVMKRGVFPSRKSYRCLIKGLCEMGEIEEGLKIQAEMVGKGFGPDLEVYEAFVDGYVKVGNFDKAGKLRNEMFEMVTRREEE